MPNSAKRPVDARRTALVERLRALLSSHDSLREATMFGGVSFLVDGHIVVAARSNGDLLVHVDPATYDELLVRGAAPAVMGAARVMGRNWVSVPEPLIRDSDELASWVQLGLAPES